MNTIIFVSGFIFHVDIINILLIVMQATRRAVIVCCHIKHIFDVRPDDIEIVGRDIVVTRGDQVVIPLA